MNQWFNDPAVRKVAGLTLLFKLMALTVVAVGAIFLSFNTANYLGNFHFPPLDLPTFLTRFKTWDAQHYLYLARFHYQPGLMSDAFYPLFPFLIKAASFLFVGQVTPAALLVSTLLTMFAVSALFVLVRELYDPELAHRVVMLLLSFPFAFFLGFIYADGAFLLLILVFFYGWTKQDQRLMTGAAFLLAWARPQGVLLTLVVLLALLYPENRARLKGALWVVGFNLLGFFLYLVYMKACVNDPFVAFKAQGFFTSGYSVGSFLHPWQWVINNFVHVHWTLNGPTDGVLARLFFIAFVALLVWVYQRMEPIYFIYTLVLGLASALSGNLMSFPRYWLMLFPLFIVLAMELKGVKRWVWALCWALQALFILLYSVNDWVA